MLLALFCSFFVNLIKKSLTTRFGQDREIYPRQRGVRLAAFNLPSIAKLTMADELHLRGVLACIHMDVHSAAVVYDTACAA